MSDDSILAAVSGITSGVRDILVPYFQSRYQGRQKLADAKELALAQAQARRIPARPRIAEALGVSEGTLLDPSEISVAGTLTRPTLSRQEVDPQVAAALGLRGRPSLTPGELTAMSGLKKQEEGEDIKARGEERKKRQSLSKTFPKAKGSYDSAVQKYDLAIKEAEKILADPDLKGATGIAQGRMKLTGGQRRIDANLRSMKSKILVGVLSGLKELSQTGASGFGALSQFEGEALRDSIATLDRTLDTEDFVDNLKVVLSDLNNSKKNVKSTFEKTYEDFLGDDIGFEAE